MIPPPREASKSQYPSGILTSPRTASGASEMGRITISDSIDAPVAVVFGYVDDHRNTTKYMQGLTKWKPTTSVTHGKGAKFEVGMKAGPTPPAPAVALQQ